MVSDAIQSIDRERMLEVRDRIDRRIMELLHPKDLFYQILDGLRSLTHYDHSSALLIRERGDNTLRLVAEQIAWTKARSRHIGLTLPIDTELEPALASAGGGASNRINPFTRTPYSVPVSGVMTRWIRGGELRC